MLRPLAKARFAPKFRVYLWIMVIIKLIIPFNFSTSFSAYNLLPDIKPTGYTSQDIDMSSINEADDNFIVTYDNNTISSDNSLHPLEENGSFGFRASVSYIDDYKANVICNETGFSEDIPLDRERYEEYDKNNDDIMPIIYDDNGKLKGKVDYSEIGVDGICDVNIVDINGRQCVEFYQYVWGLNHGNGIGFLISALAWEDGTYKVINQKCFPAETVKFKN